MSKLNKQTWKPLRRIRVEADPEDENILIKPLDEVVGEDNHSPDWKKVREEIGTMLDFPGEEAYKEPQDEDPVEDPGGQPCKEPQEREPKTFDEIARYICDLHKMKNADYGDSAYESYKDFGLISYVQRIGDKYHRIKNLTLNPYAKQIKTETIEDTFMDLAAYSIMALEALRK